MNFLNKWFTNFSWFSGITVIYAFFSQDIVFSKPIILFIVIISGLLATIPESYFKKLKVQLLKDMN